MIPRKVIETNLIIRDSLIKMISVGDKINMLRPYGVKLVEATVLDIEPTMIKVKVNHMMTAMYFAKSQILLDSNYNILVINTIGNSQNYRYYNNKGIVTII